MKRIMRLIFGPLTVNKITKSIAKMVADLEEHYADQDAKAQDHIRQSIACRNEATLALAVKNNLQSLMEAQ